MEPILVIEFLVLVFAVIYLCRILPLSLFSPVHMLILVYVITSFGGYFIYPEIDDSIAGGSAALVLTQQELSRTMEAFFYLLYAFIVGACCYVLLSGKFVSVRHRPGQIRPKLKIKRSVRVLLLLAVIFSLVSLIFGFGLEEIFWRTDYLSERNKYLVILGKALVLPALLFLGYLFGIAKSTYYKVFLSLMLIIFMTVLFSMATRRLALAPILFFMGSLAANPKSKATIMFLYISFAIAPLLMQLAFVLRALPVQGLMPFAAIITHTALTNDHVSLLSPIKNFLFSFPLAGTVMDLPSLDFSYLLTSLNPLPGFMTDWYEINQNLVLNTYTPFNALGELLNYGLTLSVGIYFFFGFYFAHLDKIIRARFVQQKGLLLALMLFGISILFILTSLQYNLRSAMRLIYYTMFIELVIALGKILIMPLVITKRLKGSQQHQPRAWRPMPDNLMDHPSALIAGGESIGEGVAVRPSGKI